jgi:TBP-interacting protein
MAKIRGTDQISAHSLPIDLLDRLLIINTRPYSADEIREILKIRAAAEKIDLDRGALEYLTQIGTRASMRYAIQLIAPAAQIAEVHQSKKICKEHVRKAEKLFVDVKKSVKYLKEFEEKFLA